MSLILLAAALGLIGPAAQAAPQVYPANDPEYAETEALKVEPQSVQTPAPRPKALPQARSQKSSQRAQNQTKNKKAPKPRAAEFLKTYEKSEDEAESDDSVSLTYHPPKEEKTKVQTKPRSKTGTKNLQTKKPLSLKSSDLAQKSTQEEGDEEAPLANGSLEQLKDQVEELQARLAEAQERLALKDQVVKEESRWTYDPVPRYRINSLAERIRYIDILLVQHGRAYDYRLLTTRELKKLVKELEAANHKPEDEAKAMSENEKDEAVAPSQIRENPLDKAEAHFRSGKNS